MYRHGGQLVSGYSAQSITTKQLQFRIGVTPALAYSLYALLTLHDMHQSECIQAYRVVEMSQMTMLFRILEDVILVDGIGDNECRPLWWNMEAEMISNWLIDPKNFRNIRFLDDESLDPQGWGGC
ncbi:unnamed protein product [Linum trigynum]|uniref:Uncharacterized protein n=1 Tax=Linum trigynum TaxID=586398 RepID=A0AAV2CR26_9ROSI